MSILVMGLSNIETTLAIERFPIEYQPVRFPFNGIESHVSGVGVNNALALHSLGSQCKYVSTVAEDEAGNRVIQSLQKQGINCEYVLKELSATPQSIIQYDPSGKRQIYVDLKDIQNSHYSQDAFNNAAQECDWLILGTLNICRPFLTWAKDNHKKVACDLHVFNNLDDEYHQDFLHHSQVIFMSNEYVLGQEQHFAQQLINRFSNVQILVIGMGAQGALLFERATGLFTQVAAQTLRPIINTVGAGDALFSAFMHYYSQFSNANEALKKAVLFAGWKIGKNGASAGFLTQEQVNAHYKNSDNPV